MEENKQKFGPKIDFETLNLSGKTTRSLTVVGVGVDGNKYALIDCHRYTVRFVTRIYLSLPKYYNLPVVRVGDCTVKIINGTRQLSITYMRLVLRDVRESSFRAQSGLLTNVYGKFKSLIATLKSVYHASSDIQMGPFLMDIGSFLLNLQSPHTISVSFVTSELLRLYSLYTRGKILFRTESIELLALATFLPDMPLDLMNILKRLSLLTNKKVFDSPSIFMDVLREVSSFIMYIVDRVPFLPEIVKSIFRRVFSVGMKYQVITDVRSCLNEWKRDRKILSHHDFCEKVVGLRTLITNDELLQDYFKTTVSVRGLFEDFVRLGKAIDSYKHTIRSEPVCFIMDGKPGTKKSALVAAIVQSFGEPVYTHVVKTIDDGKDFYDGYNNEPIFVMDDVGQQGPSQWRKIINMVSTIRLPLDCAEAALKDTKYFTSDTLLLTTNKFQGIGLQISKADGIADVGALYRRGHIFDFNNVFRDGDSLVGDIIFKHFDIHRNMFVEGFERVIDMGNIPTRCDSSNWLRVVAWAKVIAKRYRMHYANIRDDMILTQSQKDIISAYENEFELEEEFFDAESWFNWNTGDGFEWRMITDLLYTIIDNAVDLLASICVTGIDNAHFVGVGVGVVGVVLMYQFFRSKLNNVCDDKTHGALAVDEWRRVVIPKSSPFTTQSGVSTMVPSVQRHMRVIELYNQNSQPFLTQGFVSGHNIIVQYHALIKARTYLSMYSSFDDVKSCVKVLEQIPFTIRFYDVAADVAVISLPRNFISPFRKCSSYFNTQHRKGKHVVSNCFFVNVDVVLPIASNYCIYGEDVSYTNNDESFKNTIPLDNAITYSGLSVPGLCGSVIVDSQEGVVGMHVCGNGKIGVSIVFSTYILDRIRSLLDDDGNVDEQVLSSKMTSKENFSGMIFDKSFGIPSPSATSLIPSPLSNVYPITKKPANLRVFGVGTVSELAQLAYKPVCHIPPAEVEFAKKAIRTFFKKYEDLSEQEIVKGNKYLAPLNKKSVNGLFYAKDKSEYIDFEGGKYKPNFIEILNGFRDKVRKEELSLEDVASYETLKDELRPLEKVDKPRTFRITPLHVNVEMKRLFGNLFSQMMRDRWFNQMMIGVNPYEDWQRIYDILLKCGHHWDGDVGKYDKSMLPVIQDSVMAVMKEFYGGDDKYMCDFLLEYSSRLPVAVLNKTYYTTHSISSGIWLTILLNSLCNRFMTACWYYRETNKVGKKPTVTEYHRIVDFVCGDDKLNGTPVGMDWLHGLNMKSFFDSINMEFTAGDKTPISQETLPISELGFLKRKFVYHPKLMRVMCPLSLETLKNTIMWLDKTKDPNEVMSGKLNSFQREVYLHLGCESMIDEVESKCNERGVPFVRLTDEYLQYVYTFEREHLFELYKEENNKNF